MSTSELPRKEANVLKGHEGAVLAARFNSDGNYCLSCGKDRTIRLWNPHRGIHIKTYKSHGREVRDVHVTLDNSKLCSCGGDRQIFYWDVSTGRVIRKFRGHDGEVNAVKFNEYASVVVSAGYDRSLRAWDCRSHSTEPIQIIDSFSDTVMSVCLTKTEIIGGSVDGTVRTFDIRIGQEISDDLGQPVNCISLSNDNNCILANCLDSTLRLLDRSTGELLQEYKGHACKSYKMDCCLTNSDAHVTCGSEDGSIFFWDLVDASVVSKFRAHSSVVTSVSYHPKDNFEEGIDVLSILTEIGYCPSIETWNLALLACLKVGRNDLMWKLYQDMVESSVGVDIDVGCLIQAFCIDGKVSKGYEIGWCRICCRGNGKGQRDAEESTQTATRYFRETFDLSESDRFNDSLLLSKFYA
ncbi:hypothetical protein PVK06_026089 [Gossypium arboreum]|uniref:WD repeat domain-containing protein 83 n=1 Tax=Gossypium arboreum TaxID=29729 RepID=A0ABR0NXA3_GOSAR|nr:hypothetical protein PVK06_026089 [Gossypium arboreum]